MQMTFMSPGLNHILSALHPKEIKSFWRQHVGWYRTERSKIFPSDNMMTEVFGYLMPNFLQSEEMPASVRKLVEKEVNIQKFLMQYP